MVLNPIDAWKTTPPEESEPGVCDPCGEDLSPDDYHWDGDTYHLHCAPAQSVVDAVEASRNLEDASRILDALLSECLAKLRARQNGKGR